MDDAAGDEDEDEEDSLPAPPEVLPDGTDADEPDLLSVR